MSLRSRRRTKLHESTEFHCNTTISRRQRHVPTLRKLYRAVAPLCTLLPGVLYEGKVAGIAAVRVVPEKPSGGGDAGRSRGISEGLGGSEDVLDEAYARTHPGPP